VVGAFVAFHLALVPFLRLGIFPLVSAAGWCFTLPPQFWSRMGVGQAPAAPAPPPAPMPAESQPIRALPPLGAALATLLVIACNLRVLGVHVPAGYTLELGAATIGLNQWWGVFAPRKRARTAHDGWWVYVGDLQTGDRVDLASPGLRPPTWSRPPVIAETFANRRWRHYLANITLFSDDPPQGRTFAVSRQAYGRYLCRQWQGPPLKRTSVYFLHYEPLVSRDAKQAMKVAQVDCS
jgi:hypothetical protein